MTRSHSHRVPFLLTVLAVLGLVLMAPSSIGAESKPTVKDMVANSRDNCETLGGTFTVRGAADRAITECQYAEGDYTTCLITRQGADCHSLEVEEKWSPDTGDLLAAGSPDTATRESFLPHIGLRQSLE